MNNIVKNKESVNSKKKYKIAFFGNLENAFYGLVTEYNIDFVIFEKNRINTNIINYCNKNNIKYFKIITALDIEQVIKNHGNMDFFIVASFGIIFNKIILRHPKINTINIHSGILPNYRGRHPLQQAILNSEKYMGLTAHIMNLEIDKGDILNIEKLEIDYEKSYKENEKKLSLLLNKFVLKTMDNLLSNVYVKINDVGEYYRPLDKLILNKIYNIEQLKELKE